MIAAVVVVREPGEPGRADRLAVWTLEGAWSVRGYVQRSTARPGQVAALAFRRHAASRRPIIMFRASEAEAVRAVVAARAARDAARLEHDRRACEKIALALGLSGVSHDGTDHAG